MSAKICRFCGHVIHDDDFDFDADGCDDCLNANIDIKGQIKRLKEEAFDMLNYVNQIRDVRNPKL